MVVCRDRGGGLQGQRWWSVGIEVEICGDRGKWSVGIEVVVCLDRACGLWG